MIAGLPSAEQGTAEEATEAYEDGRDAGELWRLD